MSLLVAMVEQHNLTILELKRLARSVGYMQYCLIPNTLLVILSTEVIVDHYYALIMAGGVERGFGQ